MILRGLGKLIGSAILLMASITAIGLLITLLVGMFRSPWIIAGVVLLIIGWVSSTDARKEVSKWE